MIKLYTRNNYCIQCNFTKRRLDELNIPYEEIVVTNEIAQELKETYEIMQVPFVVVSDDNYWTGFKPDRIEELAVDEKRS